MMVEKKQSADGNNQIQFKNHNEVESENSQRENRIKQKAWAFATMRSDEIARVLYSDP